MFDDMRQTFAGWVSVEFAIFFAVAALILVLAIYGAQQAAKRRAALQAWAQSRGLSYFDGEDHSFDDRFGVYSGLREGSRRYAYNIIEGRFDKRAICAFDYHYETYSTDSKGKRETNHHHFSAVIVTSEVPLKPLYLRQEGLFDKVGEFLGFDDIDFESAEFSRTFRVTSPDRRWAFDVLHQKAMEFLLASPRFTLDFQPSGVMATSGGCFDPADYEAALGVVNGLLDLLPRSVVRELNEAEG